MPLFSTYKNIFPKGNERAFRASFGFSSTQLQYIYNKFIKYKLSEKWFLILMEYLTLYPNSLVHPVYWNVSRSSYFTNIEKGQKVLDNNLPPLNIDDRKDINNTATGMFRRIKAVVDGTECRIENPSGRKKSGLSRIEKQKLWAKQKLYYSYKKRMHALKYQMLVSLTTAKILDVSNANPGAMHDKKMWDEWLQEKEPNIGPDERVLGDKAYKKAKHVISPVKAKKGQSLSSFDASYNKTLGQGRVVVEQVIGRFKKFKIVHHTYRGDLKKHQRIVRICSKLTNLSLGFQPVRKQPPNVLFK